MRQWQDIPGEVDVQAVLCTMQAGPEPGAELRRLAEREMARCRPLLHPAAAVRILRVTGRSEDRLELANGAVFARGFPGGAFAGCGETAVTLCTVGEAIDGHIRAAFAAGDYPAAMAADGFAVCTLQKLGAAVARRLADDAAARGLALTGRFAPGDGPWALEEQAAVLACLPRAEKLGVRLGPSGALSPLKTATAVYGIGRGVCAGPAGCGACPCAGCPYRAGAEETVTVTAETAAGEIRIAARPGENLLEMLSTRGLLGESPCGGRGVCGKCRVIFPCGAPAPSPEDRRLLTARELEDGVRLACRVTVKKPLRLRVPDAPASSGPVALAGRAADFVPDPVTAAGRPFGAAVDIGTTTVACALVDLRTGTAVERLGGLNRQRPYGADVITRLQYVREHPDGGERLRTLIVGQLGDMLRALCARRGLDPAEIGRLTAAGNTVMLHLLLGAPAGAMAEAPYTPAFTGGMELTAAETGLPVGGPVDILPGVSAFVGADITAGLVACGVPQAPKPVLFLDLGTNGEIVLGGRETLTCCAAAAGPAFEGGGIRCGMAGVPGAVSRVDFDADPVCEVIGGGPAAGICGSGVLDTAAQLFRHGVVEASGRMRAPEETAGLRPDLAARLTRIGDERAFTLVPASPGRAAVVFTQRDVRQVQLAKAAIRAGVSLLLQHSGIGPGEVSRVLVAGGFGSYMRLDSAFAVGLLPPALRDRTESVGNAAGEGARLCLVSRGAAALADETARRMRYIEMADRPDFEENFIGSMAFGEPD